MACVFFLFLHVSAWMFYSFVFYMYLCETKYELTILLAFLMFVNDDVGNRCMIHHVT